MAWRTSLTTVVSTALGRSDPELEDRAPGSRWVEAVRVRFEEPPEGTLQLLPGRLEL